MPNFGEFNFVDGRFIKERDPVPEWFKKDDGPQLAQPSPAPKLGLLTHAVVQSPVSHWILPITCEKEDYSDIAFIGVSYILELFSVNTEDLCFYHQRNLNFICFYILTLK